MTDTDLLILPDSSVTQSSRPTDIKKSKIHFEPNEKRLLIYCIICCLLTVTYSIVVIIQLQSAFGQCVVGMNINEGGILIENVESYICRCPLYSVMLSSLFSWISIMVNFVSDLKTKKILFAHWTKYQFILSLFGFLLNVVGLGLGSYGLANWCSRLNDNSFWSSYYPHSRYSRPENTTCWHSAKSFDSEFNLKDEQFIQQLNIFYYASAVLSLEAMLIICWLMILQVSFKIWNIQKKLLKPSSAIGYNVYAPTEPQPQPNIVQEINQGCDNNVSSIYHKNNDRENQNEGTLESNEAAQNEIILND